jgi:hypothetical protein
VVFGTAGTTDRRHKVSRGRVGINRQCPSRPQVPDIQGEPDLQYHVYVRLFVCPTLIKSEPSNRSINIATVIYPHHCGPCNFTACNEVSK